jgi:transcription initiation factor TFIIB
MINSLPHNQWIDMLGKFYSVTPCTENKGIHGPVVTDLIKGELLCESCGAVLEDKVADSSSEGSFTFEERGHPKKIGLSSTLSSYDKDLSSMIAPVNKDASGNLISSSMKSTFKRLRMWDSRSKSRGKKRNLQSAFTILKLAQSKLDIKDAVIERAAYLYRKALNNNIIKGRTITGMILSSLYVSCRESNVPKTMQEFAEVGNISFRDLSRHYRVFVNALGIEIESYNPSSFVSRIGGIIGLSEKVKRDALDMIFTSKEEGISSGRSPISIAAASIYLSGIRNKQIKSQNEISKAAEISVVALRNTAKKMREKFEKKIELDN